MLSVVAAAAVLAALVARGQLMSAGNDPSGAAWAVAMLGATLATAATGLGWLVLALPLVRAQSLPGRGFGRLALVAAGPALAVVLGAYLLGRLAAADELGEFRARWIVFIAIALVVVLVGRWLERAGPDRAGAVLAGVAAGAGMLVAVGLWQTVGEAGFESFPRFASYWTLIVAGAAVAVALVVAVPLFAGLRAAPMSGLREIGSGLPTPTFRSARVVTGVVVGLTVLAAVLRFGLLEIKGFWSDEAFTVWLVEMDLAEMLAALPGLESNPPLYYVLAWGWASLFGTGEVGLRSLSAVAGTATVPVIYGAARMLASRGVAVVAAGLVAVNPLLVTYSAEARNYALFAFLGAVSLFFFARALRDARSRTLWAWALASTLAITTHYFALFLVLPAGVWLLLRVPRRRAMAAPLGAVALAGAALAPLALNQASQSKISWIAETPLSGRLWTTMTQFSVGADAVQDPVRIIQFTLLGLAAWLLVTRTSRSERRGAIITGALAAAVIAAPLALEFADRRFFLARNVLVAVPLLAVVVAAGFGARRAGWAGVAGATAFMALGVVGVVWTAVDDRLNRTDWRDLAASVGSTPEPRVVILTDPSMPDRVLPASAGGPSPLDIYLTDAEPLTASARPVREIAVVDEPREEPLSPRSPMPGFTLVDRRPTDGFVVYRYRGRSPVSVPPAGLSPRRLRRGLSHAWLQSPVATAADAGAASSPSP